MKQFGIVGWIICGLWLGSSCAQENLHVLTTFLPVYCFTVNVAGSSAEVENLLPSSASPHDYQLSPGDIKKISRATLIVANGLEVEEFLAKAMANAAPAGHRTIATLSEGLSSELIPLGSEAAAGEKRGSDPHIWLDPILAAHCVTNVLRALQREDPAHADDYSRNAAAYLARLQRLNHDIESTLAPVRSNSFVTYHDAFRYFVRRYSLKLAGVVEQVPEVTPSPKQMGRLLKAIREQHAQALFTEPGGSSRLARQIAADAKIKLDELDPLETGALQPDSYEKTMWRNAEALVRALR